MPCQWGKPAQIQKWHGHKSALNLRCRPFGLENIRYASFGPMVHRLRDLASITTAPKRLAARLENHSPFTQMDTGVGWNGCYVVELWSSWSILKRPSCKSLWESGEDGWEQTSLQTPLSVSGFLDSDQKQRDTHKNQESVEICWLGCESALVTKYDIEQILLVISLFLL